MAEDVYCTLLMSDSYLPGVAVLAHSLRDSGTKRKLAVLVSIDSLLATTVTELKALFDYIIPVERIANPSVEHLSRLGRLDLRFAFTKIALWRQEQFRKIIYVDADVVALRAPDELFDLDVNFAAAPDIGWPDIFNTGVMLLKPSMSEYWSMRTLASSGTSFDGADQGLLNEYFGNRPWERLSFNYNCTPNAGYQYEPAYRYFRSNISMVHFIGAEKPWTRGREALSSSGTGVYKELLGSWWAVYDRHYQSHLSVTHMGQVVSSARIVQQYVKDDQPRKRSITWATDGQQPAAASMSQLESFGNKESPDTSAVTTEPSMIQTERGLHPSASTGEFSAPQVNWDATRSEPPVESKPEASNLPSQRYEMSLDPVLFRAPTSYPAPPKETGYEAPTAGSEVHERPKAIFPWELTAKKATRVFADDVPEPELQPTLPVIEESRSISGQPETAPATTLTTESFSTSSSRDIPVNPWHTFSRTNAWDDDSNIDRYVRALKLSQQQRRGQVQVIHQSDPPIAEMDFALGSPDAHPISRRRESLILTDFPTEIERPSLPVTPAPVQRSSFWGDERDDDGDLPQAEGVPEQVDWNPIERLEELRRSSILATAEMPLASQRVLPEREMPGTSRSVGTSPPISPGSLASGVPQAISSRMSAPNSSSSATTSSFMTGHSTFTANRIDPDMTPEHSTYHAPEPMGQPVAGDATSVSNTRQSTITTSTMTSSRSLQLSNDESSIMDEYSIA